MNTLIDPRPLEPDWVSQPEPNGLVEWQVIKTRWNSDEKRYIQTSEFCIGSAQDLLVNLVGILRSSDPDYWIKVNAEQCTATKVDHKVIPEIQWGRGLGVLFARVSYSANSYEEFTDMDEFFGEVEWAVLQCRQFDIETDWNDPTP